MTKGDRDLSKQLPALGGALDDLLAGLRGARCGFVLLIAPFDQRDGTEVQYVANVDRPQAHDLLSTLFERWQAGLPDVPTHMKQ